MFAIHSLLIIFNIICMYDTTHALLCADNTNTALMYDNCTDCDFCTTGYRLPFNVNDKPIMFGMQADSEDLEPIKSVFHSDTSAYQVLTVCKLEKISLPGLTEYSFRCYCKMNRCNMATSMEKMMNQQMAKDMIRQEHLVNNLLGVVENVYEDQFVF